MNHTMRILSRALALAAVLGFAGCSPMARVTAPPPKSGSADFSTYVALGTSISAGWESGGLCRR